jgi:undecaprenyl-diphosphatase
MGTLIALLVYFWRDWWRLTMAWLPRGSDLQASGATDRQLGVSLVIATVPAAVVGFLFEHIIENALRAPWLVAVSLVLGGILLVAADRAGIQRDGIERVGVGKAFVVGLAQVLALAPGVSRSGITVTAALLLGLSRPAAARLSFLLSMPITAGAGILKLRHLLVDGIPADERAAFVVGVVVSFVVGLAVIGGLLRFVRTRSMDVFAAYRLTIGTIVAVVVVVRG